MKKITKLQAVGKIVESNGRFFGLSYLDKKKNEKIINVRFKQPKKAQWNKDKVNGVVSVHNVRTNRYVRIKSADMKSMRIDKKTFLIR